MFKDICSVQRIISFIPFFSNPVIIAFTVKYMVKEKAKKSLWIRFFLLIAVAAAMFIVMSFIFLTGKICTHYIVCAAAVSVIINLLLLPISFKLMGKSKKEQYNIPTPEALLGVNFGIITVLVIAFIVAAVIPADIADKNGPENTDLVSFSDSDIPGLFEKVYAVDEEEICSGEKVRLLFGDCYDTVWYKSSDFSGIKTLAAAIPQENDIMFEIAPILKSGNLRIIIAIGEEYHSDIELNKKTTVEVHDVAGKTVNIRMAGESADVEVNVKRIEQ